MITSSEDFYKKISQLTLEVKHALRIKGLIVPVKNRDGSVTLDRYTIVRDLDGYAILDYDDEVLIHRINLPQTAIIVANKMALGRHRDIELLEIDRQYGHYDFQEKLYKKTMPRADLERFSIYMTKYESAINQKQRLKLHIARSFEKLIKLI
jgi:hypothetical protein